MMRMMMTSKPTTDDMTVSSDPVSSGSVSSGSSAFLNNVNPVYIQSVSQRKHKIL